MKSFHIHVQLSGVRPLMLDRYAGDNLTQLPTVERLYLDAQRRLIIPSLNIYSLLAAENTKSVTRQFFGKAGKTVALGIASYTSIDPFEIPLLGKDGVQFTADDYGTPKIREHVAVARVKGGIPNPKRRPMIDTPWTLDFAVEYSENKYCTLENLKQAFDLGGTLGLGTFRPYYGRYELSVFDSEK